MLVCASLMSLSSIPSAVILTLTSMMALSVISMYSVAPLIWYGTTADVGGEGGGIMPPTLSPSHSGSAIFHSFTISLWECYLPLFHHLTLEMLPPTLSPSHSGNATSHSLMHTQHYTHPYTSCLLTQHYTTTNAYSSQAFSAQLPHCTGRPLHHSVLWWTCPGAAQGVPRVRPQCDSGESLLLLSTTPHPRTCTGHTPLTHPHAGD